MQRLILSQRNLFEGLDFVDEKFSTTPALTFRTEQAPTPNPSRQIPYFRHGSALGLCVSISRKQQASTASRDFYCWEAVLKTPRTKDKDPEIEELMLKCQCLEKHFLKNIRGNPYQTIENPFDRKEKERNHNLLNQSKPTPHPSPGIFLGPINVCNPLYDSLVLVKNPGVLVGPTKFPKLQSQYKKTFNYDTKRIFTVQLGHEDFFSSTRESTKGLQTVIGTEKDPWTGVGWVSIDLEDRGLFFFTYGRKNSRLFGFRGESEVCVKKKKGSKCICLGLRWS
ncbi:hypothetical protein CEXT_372481 [Caerostris extrusa]|uniref:Uncharacterized protein n=1 Tax=Caerostris extrusa TaxID=172846 RepID=A0AAV4YBN2_CAEEX|nr:hypothetical protein CEXT_372481 [Caerostris extrusa]